MRNATRSPVRHRKLGSSGAPTSQRTNNFSQRNASRSNGLKPSRPTSSLTTACLARTGRALVSVKRSKRLSLDPHGHPEVSDAGRNTEGLELEPDSHAAKREMFAEFFSRNRISHA